MATVIRDRVGDCSYDGGRTWQRCPTNTGTSQANNQLNNQIQMALTQNQALVDLVNNSPDKLQAIANFVVDNNEQGVFTVLRANGYVFNTHGEAAVIVRSILVQDTDKAKSVFSQLNKVPYLNDNTNGTGGLQAPIGTALAQNIDTGNLGNSLLCTVGSLFGLPIGCGTGGSNLTPEQIEAERKAAEEAAKAKQRNTIIIVSIISAVVIIITVIYFNNKNKNKDNKSE